MRAVSILTSWPFLKTTVVTDKLHNRRAIKLTKDDKENATQAAAEEVTNQVDSASGWLSEYLKWLGVDFDIVKEHNILTLLKSKDIKCV